MTWANSNITNSSQMRIEHIFLISDLGDVKTVQLNRKMWIIISTTLLFFVFFSLSTSGLIAICSGFLNNELQWVRRLKKKRKINHWCCLKREKTTWQYKILPLFLHSEKIFLLTVKQLILISYSLIPYGLLSTYLKTNIEITCFTYRVNSRQNM